MKGHYSVLSLRFLQTLQTLSESLPLPGIILGAFYYGYMVFQIPGGWLALRLGGARLFGAAVLVASVFTLMTPFATRWSPVALILLRILEGLVLVSVLYTEKKRCDHNKTSYIYRLEREREREREKFHERLLPFAPDFTLTLCTKTVPILTKKIP